jgi:glycosyltransferase involved in cell wall biosynthesis
MEDVKGYHHLVEACRLLKTQGVSFHCRIVGDGEERPRWNSQIQHSAANDEVVLVGAVSHERLLKYHHDASVLVIPCVETSDGRHDGIPNVFLEAIATGLPVLPTPIGGISELVPHGQNGSLVPLRDPVELVAALRRLMEDSNLRQALGNTGNKTVRAAFDNLASPLTPHRAAVGQSGADPHS